MLQSMTGFATKTVTIELEDQSNVQLTMHLKTLNARFFETTCKLPHALTTLETQLIKLLKKNLRRGSIYLTMYLGNPNAFKSAVQPSSELVGSYLNAIQKMQKQFSISGQITVSDILQLPNVFQAEEKTISSMIEKQIIESTNELIEKVVQARITEGTTLEQDLRKRTSILKQEIESVEKLATQALEKRAQEINATLEQVALNKDAATETILDIKKAALYTQLDKMDVHEEIVRFKSHLNNLATIFDAKDIEKGKRLDFTLQELMREANTIAAKAPDATISSHAITLKVELEKAREQVQNIV